MCVTWTVTAALFTPLLNWISSRGSHTAWSHGFTILFWLSITISFDVVPSQSHNNSKMPKDVVMIIHKRIVLSCCGVVMWCHSFLVCFCFFLRFHPSMFLHFYFPLMRRMDGLDLRRMDGLKDGLMKVGGIERWINGEDGEQSLGFLHGKEQPPV